MKKHDDLEAVGSGDVCQEAVYERLFRNLSPVLRNFLLYKFRDQEAAEDAVQEAFVTLWKNCKRVTEELAKAYLFKVGQNQMLKKVEKEKVHARYIGLQSGSTEEASGPDFDLEYQELSVKLQSAIEQLPDGQREVFLMNRIDGKTYAEIAELLEVSVKAIEKRMHKALLKLREVCEKI